MTKACNVLSWGTLSDYNLSKLWYDPKWSNAFATFYTHDLQIRKIGELLKTNFSRSYNHTTDTVGLKQ